MNDFEYNKIKFYIFCVCMYFFNLKLKDFILKIIVDIVIWEEIFFFCVIIWLIIYGLWWWEIFKNIGDKWFLNWRLKWVILICEDIYCFNRKYVDNCCLYVDKEL